MSARRDGEAPEVCRRLRTKTALGSVPGDPTGAPWQSGSSTTAVYRCLATMATWGPDDTLAHPHACREGRSCFRSADDE